MEECKEEELINQLMDQFIMDYLKTIKNTDTDNKHQLMERHIKEILSTMKKMEKVSELISLNVNTMANGLIINQMVKDKLL